MFLISDTEAKVSFECDTILKSHFVCERIVVITPALGLYEQVSNEDERL